MQVLLSLLLKLVLVRRNSGLLFFVCLFFLHRSACQSTVLKIPGTYSSFHSEMPNIVYVMIQSSYLPREFTESDAECLRQMLSLT